MFEPPAELDRLVLRQAREAIENDRPLRVFRAPRWARRSLWRQPVAGVHGHLSALACRRSASRCRGHGADRRAARRVPAAAPADSASNYPPGRSPPRAAPPARHASASENPAPTVEPATALPERPRAKPHVADVAQPVATGEVFVSEAEASRYAAPPAAAPSRRAARRCARADGAQLDLRNDFARRRTNAPRPKRRHRVPRWRRDAKTWLAEIERLRNAGESPVPKRRTRGVQAPASSVMQVSPDR